MTIAFTAMPVKITKSTIRFFLGGCMGDFPVFQGNEISSVYSNAAGTSIDMGQAMKLFEG
ncbi:MAG: hypothetical protein GY761_01395 [Hyphomicrobiales bacterium]|nr:hypothetical protein [Hyphomicrobiales bacterium]